MSIPLTIAIGVFTVPAAFEAALAGQQPDPIRQTAIQIALSTVFALIIVRIMIAPFYMVERDVSALDAFGQAWRDTAGQWGRLIVLQLLLTLIGVPAQVLNIGLQIYAQGIDQADPDAAAAAMPVLLALYTGIAVLSAGVFVLGQLMFASAYRQLAGPRPEGEVASA